MKLNFQRQRMAEADLPEDFVSVRHFISNGSRRLPTVNHQLHVMQVARYVLENPTEMCVDANG